MAKEAIVYPMAGQRLDDLIAVKHKVRTHKGRFFFIFIGAKLSHAFC